MLPGFDLDSFPFMVDYDTGIYGGNVTDSYLLLNLQDITKGPLVYGSASNRGEWPATFFIDHGNNKIDFHYCTVTLKEKDMQQAIKSNNLESLLEP